MARDRVEPCESYICKGQCKKEEKQITTDIVRNVESINHALERSI